jgi:hypothetical protein
VLHPLNSVPPSSLRRANLEVGEPGSHPQAGGSRGQVHPGRRDEASSAGSLPTPPAPPLPFSEPGRRLAASVSPPPWTGFPHQTPKHTPLLLILQMLSHDHLHQHSLSARVPAFPSAWPAARDHQSPRPRTDHRPPPLVPASSGAEGPQDSGVP